MTLPDSSFDASVVIGSGASSPVDDPGFPVVTALVIGAGELVTLCTLVLPGSIFKLVGYLTGLFVTLPAIGVHRQLLRRRAAVAGIVSTSTGDWLIRMFTFLGMLLCVGNAVMLALAWSR